MFYVKVCQKPRKKSCLLAHSNFTHISQIKIKTVTNSLFCLGRLLVFKECKIAVPTRPRNPIYLQRELSTEFLKKSLKIGVKKIEKIDSEPQFCRYHHEN